MQIMLPRSVGSSVAEVVEILSDTRLKIRKEFSGIAKVRDRIKEAQAAGQQGLSYKRLPFVDQHEMYQYVYQCLTEGGAICIFPEGTYFFMSRVAQPDPFQDPQSPYYYYS